MDEGDRLAALADPTRRRVFELLAVVGPHAVRDLATAVAVTPQAVSQHLRVLLDAGLVTATPQGTRRIYRADPAGLMALHAWVDAHWTSVLDHFERAASRREAMSVAQPIPPVIKQRVVPLPVEDAFRLFTAEIGTWWPVATHSITGDSETADADRIVAVRFEGRVGGRVVEVTASGIEHAWADVLAWNPPSRFVLSWHPSPEPEAASRLEVRFRAVAGGTEVQLEHGGWEEFGDRGTALRDNYDPGWDLVLDRLDRAVRRAA